MEHPISRVVVQRLCDERAELIPYLVRVIDSMELHGGLYRDKLAEVMPDEVVDELDEWLKGHLDKTSRGRRLREDHPGGMAAGLRLLERLFPEYWDELAQHPA